MSIVGGLDIHRKQLTFDYVEVETGRLEHGHPQWLLWGWPCSPMSEMYGEAEPGSGCRSSLRRRRCRPPL
jgi:hypothetical protein